jgi:hypothetical protein
LKLNQALLCFVSSSSSISLLNDTKMIKILNRRFDQQQQHKKVNKTLCPFLYGPLKVYGKYFISTR